MQTWTTTTVLLDRLAEADDRAWAEFAGRFRAPITRFGRTMGLPDDACEDLAQESLAAFLRAYRDGRYDRDRGALRSWLFGIAHKEALKLRRSRARDPRQGPEGAGRTTFFSAQPDESSLRSAWDEEWDRYALARCLDQARAEFEPSTFEAFELVVLRDLSPSSVADRLATTRNAVYIAKHRVLTRLSELQEEFATIA